MVSMAGDYGDVELGGSHGGGVGPKDRPNGRSVC